MTFSQRLLIIIEITKIDIRKYVLFEKRMKYIVTKIYIVFFNLFLEGIVGFILFHIFAL